MSRISMGAVLTKVVLDAAVKRAREEGVRVELHDDREPGLRFRAGARLLEVLGSEPAQPL